MFALLNLWIKSCLNMNVRRWTKLRLWLLFIYESFGAARILLLISRHKSKFMPDCCLQHVLKCENRFSWIIQYKHYRLCGVALWSLMAALKLFTPHLCSHAHSFVHTLPFLSATRTPTPTRSVIFLKTSQTFTYPLIMHCGFPSFRHLI